MTFCIALPGRVRGVPTSPMVCIQHALHHACHCTLDIIIIACCMLLVVAALQRWAKAVTALLADMAALSACHLKVLICWLPTYLSILAPSYTTRQTWLCNGASMLWQTGSGHASCQARMGGHVLTEDVGVVGKRHKTTCTHYQFETGAFNHNQWCCGCASRNTDTHYLLLHG